MLTADSQQSSSVGRFEPNEIAIAHPMIRHKTAMTSDIVVPTLVIDGHTDSDGDDEANLNLSLLRATNVKNWLITEYDFITSQMIDARGFGEEQPTINNDTPENKQLNRRIEVLVWE